MMRPGTVLMRLGVAPMHTSIVLMRSGVVPMRFPVMLVDRELRRGHACTEDAVGAQRTPIERQAAKRRLKVREGKTGVEKRAEHHVAGNSGEAVEIQHASH
jgi:hypothetical protein